MQLTPATAGSPPSVPHARRLRVAACLLLAATTPTAATAAAPGEAGTRIETSGLLYAENQRTTVIEPQARITRIFKDGQSLSAQFSFDVMSGASPTGANPAGVPQTTTSASGHTTTIPANQVPTARFEDKRGALDVAWTRPMGLLTSTVGGHVSLEKDYRSLGGNAKLDVDLDDRLMTLTIGVGGNLDRVTPMGGIPPGLSAGARALSDGKSKQVATGLLGLSRVLSRRWLAGVNVSGTVERGYLTEPYKVVSTLDAISGLTTGQLTENRPEHRRRNSVLANSVYHLRTDILYASYREYWDDWDIRSHTLDLRYRREHPGSQTWLEPHVRLYTQRAASFFRQGLVEGAPRPSFASADTRLGTLRTLTLGATYGFHLSGRPGEFTVRGEYMGQFGNGHPGDAVGVQRDYNLAPAMTVGSIVLGWSFDL